jgi:hypothetical protein
MYKNMDEDGQMNIDCRLDAEKAMDENIATLLSFAHSQLKKSEGYDITKNRFEGYGILADAAAGVTRTKKQLDEGMKSLLQVLSTDESRAIDEINSIENSAVELVDAAIQMAAQTMRVTSDLYDNLANNTEEPFAEYASGSDFEEV